MYKELVNSRDEKIEKLKSIIISIYICYYIKLIKKQIEQSLITNLEENF